jgi:hypothetical protein
MVPGMVFSNGGAQLLNSTLTWHPCQTADILYLHRQLPVMEKLSFLKYRTPYETVATSYYHVRFKKQDGKNSMHHCL